MKAAISCSSTSRSTQRAPLSSTISIPGCSTTAAGLRVCRGRTGRKDFGSGGNCKAASREPMACVS